MSFAALGSKGARRAFAASKRKEIEMEDFDFDEIYGGKFVCASDLKKPAIVIVDNVSTETFTKPGESSRTKAVLHFRGTKKGFVLNQTNARVMALMFGKRPTDWVGNPILLCPELVSFAGKPTQALRIHPAPRPRVEGPQSASAAAQAPAHASATPSAAPGDLRAPRATDELDDEIPF